MSARQDDDRRIAEMWIYINQLQRRIAESGANKNTLLKPASPVEELMAEGIIMNLLRITGEASRMSVATKIRYPMVPWDNITGFGNRLVHDYPGTNLEDVWYVIEHDLDQLKKVCLTYCDERNLTPDTLIEKHNNDLLVFEELDK